MLRRFEAAGRRGLPVGPEPSAVLANAVLSAADRTIASQGVRHLRWVDDFTVAVPDRDAARRVLEAVRGSLIRFGLEASPEKTRIIDADGLPLWLDGAEARSSGSRPERAPHPDDSPEPA